MATLKKSEGSEPITSRTSKLNQLLNGRHAQSGESKCCISREGLLDALLVLYDECKTDALLKNQYISSFVSKYSSTVAELKRLRISIGDFEVKNVIGRGHFGEVEVVREKCSGDVYALKILHKVDMLSQQNVAFYEEERDIMAQSGSSWITQLHYAFQDHNNLYLVMDFHPGGDLLSLLGRFDDVFEESMARFYLAEMSLAIHTLHTMGYVHRDVKPENILIDRTGHVKLADFGSACKLRDSNSSVSNMPVGTPDYISPEVLEKINSSETRGSFGEECDWWSLGICMYEMLYSRTPFTDDSGSMVNTYANIMNFKKTLKFPGDIEVSVAAKALIKGLLSGADQRFKYEKVCSHSFFATVNLDTIRDTVPPFIPTINSSDDTSNFEEFEKAKPQPKAVDLKSSAGFSGKDLPFVGFTFTKALSVADRPSQEVSTPACKSSLERRLATKTKELQELREKYKEIEHRDGMIKTKHEQMKRTLNEKEESLVKVETERNVLEKDLSKYITENKSLQRRLDQENEDRANSEAKAMKLMEEISKQSSVAQSMMEAALHAEIEECKSCLLELEEEKVDLHRQITVIKQQLTQEEEVVKCKDKQIADLKSDLSAYKKKARGRSEDAASVLDASNAQFRIKETELQMQLDEALRQKKEIQEMLNQVQDNNVKLEDEIFQLKLDRDSQETAEKKLIVIEGRRKSLEAKVSKLLIVEKQEKELRPQLANKNTEVKRLQEKVADLEDKLENREMESNKKEKIHKQRSAQLSAKIEDLENELYKLRDERSSIQEQSIIIFEENEERLRIIQEQESTISLLKGNVAILEVQIGNLKCTMEEEIMRMQTPKRRTTKSVSGAAVQTDTPCTPKKFLSGGVQTEDSQKVSGMTQTSFSVNCSGTSCQTDTPKKACSSGGMQTEDSEKVSGATQTSFIAPSKPKRRYMSGGMQTETAHNMSGSTQTSFMSSPAKEERGTNISSTHHSSRIKTSIHVYSSDDEDETLEESVNVTVKVRTRSRSRSQERKQTHEVPGKHKGKSSDMKKESNGMTDAYDWEEEDSTLEIDEEEEERVRLAEEAGEVIDDSKTKKNVKTWRQVRRHLQKELSDVRQEKLFLELRVETLLKELETFKESTHQQRIRALDFKHDLKEKTANYEKELTEVKDKLAKAEIELAEAKETEANAKEKEASVKARLSKVQQELDSLREESRKEIARLGLIKTELETKIKTSEHRYRSSEESCLEAQENAMKYEKEMIENKLRVAELAPKCKDLEVKLKFALEAKTKLKLENDRLKDELADKTRQSDVLTQKTKQLKVVCSELEATITDYETINSNYEQKIEQWTKEKQTYEKAVEERETEIDHTHKQLLSEKHDRQKLENQLTKREKVHENSEMTYRAEINHLKQKHDQQRIRIETLNHQLTEMEHSLSMMEVDRNSSKRKHEVLEAENIKLKEEISSYITKISEHKTSNFKLSKNLEEAMERYELLANHKTDLENQMENIQAQHSHEKYKLESTIAQQTKLIEYLQDKVENPPKKKKGLFSGRKDQPAAGIQFRELQHTLDHERERNSSLRQEILKLKDELHCSKTELISLKGNEEFSKTTISATSHNPAVSMLTLSPSVQQYPPAMSTPKDKPTPARQPRSERMRHNIPHRFMSGLNSRATKCAVCLGSVHFVKQASKCLECNIVCHPKCVTDLPASCGLPTEYARHFTDMLTRAKAVSTSKLSVANLRLEMQGWMKVPKAGNHVWEKRWIQLRNNYLFIYTSSNTDSDPVDEFDLCPSNGEVTIHSAVTAADLNNTASSDLPYILRIEFEPDTTCWPGRSIYLMALSFTDKQKWVATLEALVNHSGKEDRIKEIKVLGNPMFKSNKGSRLEVNCSLGMSEDNILLGAEEGLFAMELSNGPDTRPLTKIRGMDNVQMLEDVPGLGFIVAVIGKDRSVAVIEKRAIEQYMTHHSRSNLNQKPSITPQHIDGAVSCTTFCVSTQADGVYLCIANADRLLIYKYNNRREIFCCKDEIETSEPCSCMAFGMGFLIIGTDRFYRISIPDLLLTDFVDKTDTSLAFAAFGAARYESFPIAVLKVSPPKLVEEFLLCFSEFGVFVDCAGRRTRKQNMKWSGLPLSFAYQAPYLYVVYYNTLQVVDIVPADSELTQGGRKFLNIINPRYLGPAITPSAVYIVSLREQDTEVICFKGNMNNIEFKQPPENKENQEYSYPFRTPSKKDIEHRTTPANQADYRTPSKRYGDASHHTQFQGPAVIEATPPVHIRKMSTSPRRQRQRHKQGQITTSDEDETSSESNFGDDLTNTRSKMRTPASVVQSERSASHRTISTLDRFLNDESARRAESRQAKTGGHGTVSGLRGMFEEQRGIPRKY